jgi:hypothetical protein
MGLDRFRLRLAGVKSFSQSAKIDAGKSAMLTKTGSPDALSAVKDKPKIANAKIAWTITNIHGSRFITNSTHYSHYLINRI